MRIFCDDRPGPAEIYVRTMDARIADGRNIVTYPVLGRPKSSNASGILSTLPAAELLIDELMRGGVFGNWPLSVAE